MKKFLFLFVLMTACTVGPDYRRPNDISNSKLESVFQDSPPKETGFLTIKDKTLQKLIKETLQNNKDLKMAQARLKQARASLAITTAEALPSLDASAKYNYLKESKNVGPVLDEDYYMVGFDATWELDLFGANRRKRESKEASVRQAVENLKDIQISLIAEVMLDYIHLRIEEALLKDAQETVSHLSALTNNSENRYAAGISNLVELRNAKYQIEEAKEKIPQIQTQIAQIQNALAFLAGLLPTELNQTLQQEEGSTDFFDYKILFQIPASIIRNRPDVRAAEEALIAQNAQIGVAVAQIYPDISLSALFGLQSLHANKLFNHKSDTINFVPEISLPLFHFGALRKNIDLQKAATEELIDAYEKSILNAAMEIKNALVALENAYEELLSAQSAFDQMEHILHLTQHQYTSGLVPLDNLLKAELNTLQAHTNKTQAYQTVCENIVHVYKSTGGLDRKAK